MESISYSRRLLSPFHGVQQIIALKGGVAESMDGYDWKLYVAHDEIISHTGLSEVVYGSWNSIRGLSRSRIRGTLPCNIIESIGERLIVALEEHAHKVPFPTADTYELWLLDEEESKPLALLDSALTEEPLSPIDRPAWYPGGQASQHFSSNSGDAADLSCTISTAAGKRPFAIWIKRHHKGDGSGQHGEHFSADEFPELLVRDKWKDDKQHRLVCDFLNWQAPWLLQLKLAPVLRKQLEQAAWKRPIETSRVYRLFPDILDQQGLTTTRVKARIISDQPTHQQVNEPFYPFVNK
ncbi:MAG: hypothetical protein ABW157_15080 [Candidatus Thiodiazotropha sp. LLP2]